MKRKFKQWWSSIPPISTKQTITPRPYWTLNTKRPRYMRLEMQVLVLDKHNNMAELNRLMGSQPSRSTRLFENCLWTSWIIFKRNTLSIVKIQVILTPTSTRSRPHDVPLHGMVVYHLQIAYVQINDKKSTHIVSK